jgi:hypothetical protein
MRLDPDWVALRNRIEDIMAFEIYTSGCGDCQTHGEREAASRITDLIYDLHKDSSSLSVRGE